jgi:hypothetical protein
MGAAVVELPRIPKWLPCERCTTTGSPSELDPRLCEVCLPSPEIEERLWREVRLRIADAKRAASAGPQEWDRRAVSPDTEHAWIWRPGWGRAHLFTIGTTTSRCGRVWVIRPIYANPLLADPETTSACRACWHAYRGSAA